MREQQKAGGAIVGEVLARQGVRFLFTLCGGHISPILVDSKSRGIQVVDVRDEKNAVFGADAVARMTGTVGVAAVTAGPGVTNTVTAVKNAQMAQSPIVILGGATGTLLKGRGSLQDIDQLSLMAPITKWATGVKTLSSLGPTLDRAFDVARSGVPGPVFVEIPVDLLYPEALVTEQYMSESGAKDAKDLGTKAFGLFLRAYLYRQFHAPRLAPDVTLPSFEDLKPKADLSARVDQVAQLLARAERPVLVVGSQAVVNEPDPEGVADAVRKLGIPTYLAGMGRGLLGRYADIQFRHKRSKALKAADLVLIAGFPFDFRLNYGRSIGRKATLVAANLSSEDLRKNRRPDVALQMHPGRFLRQLASRAGSGAGRWEPWFETLRANEQGREDEIEQMASAPSDLVNPLQFFRRLEEKMDDDAVLVVDGGDFVATCSYIVRPRKPLAWLDPGVFGTLGVGGGFAVGAALCRPKSEVWLIYGDGSCAYSVSEIDTCVRHGLAPIAIVGNDGSWAQIAREQVEMLGDDVGTVLLRTDYEKVAEGYGGVGLRLDDPAKIDAVLDEAKALAKQGKPVVVNVHIATTDFRKGSISM
ncbi:MAG: thiamine pyrophosphate-binding protein [Myxococcota bacterium]